MKKLRKLRLNDTQKLSLKEQDLVLAGLGDCYCINVGNTHEEWEQQIVSTPDYWGAVSGGLQFIGGIYCVAQSGGILTPLLGAEIAFGGSYAIYSMNRKSLLTRYHTMQLINKYPKLHREIGVRETLNYIN